VIEKKTVLVLGAGASFPYGFPLGATLKAQILDVHNSAAARLALEGLGIDAGMLGQFQRKFQGSQLASIDLFLKHWEDYAALGKACIAACVGRAESEFLRKILDSSFATDDWYTLFWNSLANVSEAQFQSNKVAVITFTYDRSLEMFLSYAYSNTYGCDLKTGWSRVASAIKIVHVYGHLGDLSDEAKQRLEVGLEVNVEYLKSAQESIRVIGDRIQSSTRDECGLLIAEAERVCYLGFGFAE
jgi:hypothetical protein